MSFKNISVFFFYSNNAFHSSRRNNYVAVNGIDFELTATIQISPAELFMLKAEALVAISKCLELFLFSFAI